MSHLLIIEDDENLGTSLRNYLKREGYELKWAKNLEEGRQMYDKNSSLVILDWMLPDGQGVDFLKELRGRNDRTPVIILTAKSDLVDKVVGLETGADDYMTKPFEPRELLARIRVQLRTPKEKMEADQKELIEVNGITIDLHQHKVMYMNQEIDLTKMEFELLKLLAMYPNRAFSREEILNKVWGYENYPTTRTVDTHILQLRQKFYDEMIETIRGIGYKLKASV